MTTRPWLSQHNHVRISILDSIDFRFAIVDRCWKKSNNRMILFTWKIVISPEKLYVIAFCRNPVDQRFLHYSLRKATKYAWCCVVCFLPYIWAFSKFLRCAAFHIFFDIFLSSETTTVLCDIGHLQAYSLGQYKVHVLKYNIGTIWRHNLPAPLSRSSLDTLRDLDTTACMSGV